MRLLWIEDDYYHIKGLVRPLEKKGYIIENASSTNSAFKKLQEWQKYDLFIVDAILPLADKNTNSILPEVKKWSEEEYLGVSLLEYMYFELHITKPVIALSVVSDQLQEKLKSIGVNEIVLKRSALPRQIMDIVNKLITGDIKNEK